MKKYDDLVDDIVSEETNVANSDTGLSPTSHIMGTEILMKYCQKSKN